MKSMTIFKFDGELDLNSELNVFEPCDQFNDVSVGWNKMFDMLSINVRPDSMYMECKIQTKKVPSSVVKDELAIKIEEYKQTTNTTPTPKIKKALKEDVINRLMINAFKISKTIRVLFLTDKKLILVDNVSKDVDTVVNLIRDTFGIKLTLLLNCDDMSSKLRNFYYNNKNDLLKLGDNLSLTYDESEYKFKNVVVDDTQYSEFVVDSEIKDLQLNYNNELKFTVDAKGKVKSIKVLESLQTTIDEDLDFNEESEQVEQTDIDDFLATEYILTDVYSKMVGELLKVFGDE